MKPYNINRAKDLNDQWDTVKDARGKIHENSVVIMIVKSPDGDVLFNINTAQARAVLDDKEEDLKKRLAMIGVLVD